ncbi:MAG: acyl carrier protein [Rhodobacteraceae bacterium]|nr:acyl carrier protein [Paracoccaceae bacterium]
MSNVSTETMRATVIEVVKDTILDWDLDLEEEITGKTTLIGELAFESIDVVQFCVAIEEKLGRKGLPFEKLFINDGSYVDDVSVDTVTDFLLSAAVAA